MRDDFPEDVKRVIANRAGLICSNPSCEASTSGPQDDPSKALNIGVAAHITAASPGGPRYNAVLSSEQRSSAWNGLWLCQNCAKLVDNDVSLFPEDFLRAWKTIREHNALHSIGKTKTAAIETESQRKLRAIADWKGKGVMLVKMPNSREAMTLGARPWAPNLVTLTDCNEFYVAVAFSGVHGDGWHRTIPLDNIKIGWDSKYMCMELLEYP